MAKEITLSRGMVAIVDDEDFDWLNQWKWSALRIQRGNGKERFYACRVQMIDGKQVMFLMHRVILGGIMQVDHRDRDGLNNRRGNLRDASSSQNSLNQDGHCDRKSRFKGVYMHKKNRRWIAEFRGKYLGSFDSDDLAAAAYDRAALDYDAQFARTNADMKEAA